MGVAGTEPLPEDFLTVEGYLAMEAGSEVRHELVGGRVYPMAGGSRRHDLAAFWLARLLADAYEPLGCAVFPHNRKLRIESLFYHPDVFVHCGPSAHEQYDDDATVIVEVLSPESRTRDRREKAAQYVRLSALQAYLVVDPDEPHIEVFAPVEGVWYWRAYGPGTAVTVGPAVVEVDALHQYVQTLG